MDLPMLQKVKLLLWIGKFGTLLQQVLFILSLKEHHFITGDIIENSSNFIPYIILKFNK